MAGPSNLTLAVRALRRSRGFTLTAIGALALGIGANTAIFSVVNKVLLEPLPYPDPDRLVQLMSASPLGNQSVVSIPKYISWVDNTYIFQQIAAYEIGGPSVTLMRNDLSEALRAARVSASYFPLFGADALKGRTFTRDEDRPRATPVAVLSHHIWRTRFRGDPALVGQYISLDGERHKVIGILAPDFHVDPPADVWLPLRAGSMSNDHVGRIRVAARLKQGVSVKEAQDVMGRNLGYFLRRHPHAPMLFQETFTAIPLREAIVGDVRQALYFVAGAVGFVLLICCANVASLLLARAARRAREMAIRTALGARRRQIVYQLLTESLVLSLAGGMLGLTLGYFGVRQILAISPVDIPRIGANGAAIAMDWRIFAFTLLTSMLTGLLFGLAPAVYSARTDVGSLVKDSATQSGMGFRRSRSASALVIGEMAMALVLLAAAGLMIRSVVAKRTAHRGFDEQNVLTVEMSLAGSQFEKTSHVAELVRAGEARLRTIPGVMSVTATAAVPLESGIDMPFTIHGRDQFMVGRYHGTANWRTVSPGYFDVFQVRLLRGRQFTDADNEHAAGVVMINRAMLKRFWQAVDANPIGDFITIAKDLGRGTEEEPRQVIGVVADVSDAGLGAQPMMYVPIAQLTDAMTVRTNRLLPLTWAVRVAPGPGNASAEIPSRIESVSGGVPLERLRTMHELVARSSARTQFYAMLLTLFAVIAVLLAGFGLYGLMAYSVQQRTREIGIRMALGAGPADLRGMVVWQGMRLALLGIALGIPLGLALTRVMVSLIFGIATWDPAVFGAVAFLLGVVALLAAYVPSLRATQVNPSTALSN